MFNKKNNLIKDLKAENNSLKEHCEKLSFNLDLQKENNKELQDKNNKRIKDLEKQNFIMAENNQKLIDWVYGIIEKVGTYEVFISLLKLL